MVALQRVIIKVSVQNLGIIALLGFFVALLVPLLLSYKRFMGLVRVAIYLLAFYLVAPGVFASVQVLKAIAEAPPSTEYDLESLLSVAASAIFTHIVFFVLETYILTDRLMPLETVFREEQSIWAIPRKTLMLLCILFASQLITSPDFLDLFTLTDLEKIMFKVVAFNPAFVAGLFFVFAMLILQLIALAKEQLSASPAPPTPVDKGTQVDINNDEEYRIFLREQERNRRQLASVAPHAEEEDVLPASR